MHQFMCGVREGEGFAFVYNITVHSSTNAALFELLYGFVPTKPLSKHLRLPNIVSAQSYR